LVPTEKNLLESFWYDFVHYKNVKPGATVTEFLDSRVVKFKRVIEDSDERPKKRQMYRDLVNALYNRSIRAEIITFLQAPEPERGYQALVDKIYRAWRAEERQPVVKARNRKPASRDRDGKGAPFSARTYVIAAEIHHELEERQEEFHRLCEEKDGLEKFVKQRFGVEQLPGTFKKFKHFAYSAVLKGVNESQRGQLRPCFRQIKEHPEVFGKAVAAKARQIFEKYFD
jgi:hypothetical protein